MTQLYSPFGHDIVELNTRRPTVPWLQWFESLSSVSGTSTVTTASVTGSGMVVDTIDVGAGVGAFWLYSVTDATRIKAGIIGICWKSDGTLPTSHMQMDVTSIGVTTTLTFAFDYSSPNIRLKATDATRTWTFNSLRVVI